MVNSGEVLTKRITLNRLKKERPRGKASREVESLQANKTSYLEYKIEDDELIKYSCKENKKIRRYESSKECIRNRIGIRPFGYYYNKGLESQKSKQWIKSVDYFTKQLDKHEIRNSYYYRALAKFNFNNLVGSLEDVNKAIKRYPNFLYSYHLRSKIKNKIMKE